MPKFEKVDKHTIKITVEKSDNIPLAVIYKNKETMLKQKEKAQEALKQITKAIYNLDEVIEEAEALGITVKEETTPPKEKK